MKFEAAQRKSIDSSPETLNLIPVAQH